MPVLAEIKPVGHWMLSAPRAAPVCDLVRLQQAVRDNTDEATQMLEWVRGQMPKQYPDECNQVLLEASRRFFPKLPRANPADRTPDSRAMWRLAKDVRSAPDPDPVKQAELEAAQLHHKQLARQCKKERAAKFLEGVDEAIAEGASQVAYSTLKQLRPWQPPARAQLKNLQGKLMSPAEELEELKSFASSTFGAHPPLEDGRTPLPVYKAASSSSTGFSPSGGLEVMRRRSQSFA